MLKSMKVNRLIDVTWYGSDYVIASTLSFRVVAVYFRVFPIILSYKISLSTCIAVFAGIDISLILYRTADNSV